ncbi:MAG: cadmium-translocating P-type ATPase [Chitinophagaceae bacterium]|nr:cadmium-translocating P-type ATPase [Bacteroidota bacterium]MCC6258464.1 cadmium-translocating P-type ATPase [Chitinophagaceae bacterium]MCW5915729.1 cadmium-translocating P-type ATPase [Ferruginibacter sp.]
MEKIEWRVEGMHCTNCALSIRKYLEKEGQEEVKVNFIGGDISFKHLGTVSADRLKQGISELGYKVTSTVASGITAEPVKQNRFNLKFTSHLHRFLFCLPFTLVLMLHMLPWHIHFLMNPWIQLFICLPVFVVGMGYFGKSALRSLRKGYPNMDVLIAMGATAAFVYSLVGTLGNLGPDYIFYETAATIITLVFLGEYVEHISVDATQKELKKLSAQQVVMANMIAFDDKYQEQVFQVESAQLKVGDLVLIRTGEQVPADCKILSGNVEVSEALLTGESRPLTKTKKDQLIGGSIIEDGSCKAQVTAVGKDTVLSTIITMVKNAEAERPPLQQLADKISAIFVPAVIGIAILTFLINYFGFHVSGTSSLMRSIAVLVISCPCAMGLATPAAIAVGLGRAAKQGVLFRDAKSLELFKHIKTVVFDKTGTLTLGQFTLSDMHTLMNEDEFKKIIVSLEKYSTHPLARAVIRIWDTVVPNPLFEVSEIKGTGMRAKDKEGNVWELGSTDFYKQGTQPEPGHTAYLFKNGALQGWFDLSDTVRPEAAEVIAYLHQKGMETILLSGDSEEKVSALARELGIKKYFAGFKPDEKLKKIESLNKISPVVMVGDGINDAPALAKAAVGISMSDASHLALQSSQVVLMNSGLKQLPLSMGLGKHTFLTIRSNLFWAFIYNIVAIPAAAMGFMAPRFAAFAMGFSDVVLALNSLWLKFKKVT